MIRFLFPLILIIVAVGGYFRFTKPVLSDIDTLRAEREKLNTALDNAKQLRTEQDKLLATYREIPPADIERLTKFLPDNVDNVRLIIDINNIAKKSGMTIKNIKINAGEGKSESSVIGSGGTEAVDKGTVILGFSVSGPYVNFQNFLFDLARSLRLVDIDTVAFAAGEQSDSYTYAVTIKTYWLK